MIPLAFLALESTLPSPPPMAQLLTVLTGFALLAGLGLPAQAARTATDCNLVSAQTVEVVDIQLAGLFMSE
jgi:hypothetical protein